MMSRPSVQRVTPTELSRRPYTAPPRQAKEPRNWWRIAAIWLAVALALEVIATGALMKGVANGSIW